ncbi:juxtaposed with another zinc finger protein 1 [Hydra vulgaris]|uniref:Juxtaposed with another zinc finger protein 1 n=1 Tax=Hydra vulgaris TaxID=6087 RepID=A0ABM4CVQ7_HYDVU
MAAFYKYICRFENCRKKFSSLVDLIDHIEYLHIIRDPIVLNQQELSQPPAIALSYVNCFFSENLRKARPTLPSDIELKRSCEIEKPSLNNSELYSDSLDSFLDESDVFSDVGSDDSCQSWVANNINAIKVQTDSNLINVSTSLPNTITNESLQGKFTCLEDSEGKKRFLCTVPGCSKRYKNINGIKYHVKNGHNKKEGLSSEIKKSYICHCGKAYKSQSGMRHHQNTQHILTGPTTQNHLSPYTPVQFDARVDNNFKQPQAKIMKLNPVEELYQPHTPPSPENLVS